jgi:hypothetical protein
LLPTTLQILKFLGPLTLSDPFFFSFLDLIISAVSDQMKYMINASQRLVEHFKWAPVLLSALLAGGGKRNSHMCLMDIVNSTGYDNLNKFSSHKVLDVSAIPFPLLDKNKEFRKGVYEYLKDVEGISYHPLSTDDKLLYGLELADGPLYVPPVILPYLVEKLKNELPSKVKTLFPINSLKLYVGYFLIKFLNKVIFLVNMV